MERKSREHTDRAAATHTASLGDQKQSKDGRAFVRRWLSLESLRKARQLRTLAITRYTTSAFLSVLHTGTYLLKKPYAKPYPWPAQVKTPCRRCGLCTHTHARVRRDVPCLAPCCS